MARKKSNIHYIYKTTCNVTGKWYVGMHSTSNLDDGYMGSGKILRYSIRKYGKDNHTKEILEYLPTREELVIREIEIVTQELIGDGLCINLKEGSTGGFTPEQQKLNAIKSNERQKWLWENDLEWGEKRREKGSINMIKQYEDGLRDREVNYDWNGKKHSEETKNKMSESSKGNGSGNKNSQFGKCWVTNESENKKIYRGDEIPQGWRLGRVMKKN